MIFEVDKSKEGLGIGFFPDYVSKRKKFLEKYPLKVDPIPYKIFAIFLKGTEPPH